MTIAIIVPPTGIAGRGPILPALQSAALRLLGRKPPTFYGSASTFEMEIADFANEVATDICKYQDWQMLTRIATVVADGIDSDVNLPIDYDRQLLDADIQQSRSYLWGYDHITDINDFIFRQDQGLNLLPGGWIIYGGLLRFLQPPSGEARFPYITNNYAASQDGQSKSAFTADTDIFLLPERLLTLGIIWRWRENKKLDASGDQEAFIKALDEYAAKDKGSSIIRFTGRRRGLNTSVPYMGVARY